MTPPPPSGSVRLFLRIRKKKRKFSGNHSFLAILNDWHAISSFPPTVNKGWRPGPLQKGATSKDLSVMRINKGAPMFQVCHGGITFINPRWPLLLSQMNPDRSGSIVLLNHKNPDYCGSVIIVCGHKNRDSWGRLI